MTRDFTGEDALPTRYCADCGTKIHPRAEICPHCGVRQYSPTARLRGQGYRWTPNRVVAGLLAILVVGGLGAHKFYMGRAAMGLVYLLFAWTLIPFIIATIEGIRFLLMTDEAFEEQYWR